MPIDNSKWNSTGAFDIIQMIMTFLQTGNLVPPTAKELTIYDLDRITSVNQDRQAAMQAMDVKAFEQLGDFLTTNFGFEKDTVDKIVGIAEMVDNFAGGNLPRHLRHKLAGPQGNVKLTLDELHRLFLSEQRDSTGELLSSDINYSKSYMEAYKAQHDALREAGVGVENWADISDLQDIAYGRGVFKHKNFKQILEDSQQNDKRAEDTAKQVRLAIEDDLVQKGVIRKDEDGNIAYDQDSEKFDNTMADIKSAMDKVNPELWEKNEGKIKDYFNKFSNFLKATNEELDKISKGEEGVRQKIKELEAQRDAATDEGEITKINKEIQTQEEILTSYEQRRVTANRKYTENITGLRTSEEFKEYEQYIDVKKLEAQVNSANAANDVVQVYHQLHPIQAALHRMGVSMDMGQVSEYVKGVSGGKTYTDPEVNKEITGAITYGLNKLLDETTGLTPSDKILAMQQLQETIAGTSLAPHGAQYLADVAQQISALTKDGTDWMTKGAKVGQATTGDILSDTAQRVAQTRTSSAGNMIGAMLSLGVISNADLAIDKNGNFAPDNEILNEIQKGLNNGTLTHYSAARLIHKYNPSISEAAALVQLEMIQDNQVSLSQASNADSALLGMDFTNRYERLFNYNLNDSNHVQTLQPHKQALDKMVDRIKGLSGAEQKAYAGAWEEFTDAKGSELAKVAKSKGTQYDRLREDLGLDKFLDVDENTGEVKLKENVTEKEFNDYLANKQQALKLIGIDLGMSNVPAAIIANQAALEARSLETESPEGVVERYKQKAADEKMRKAAEADAKAKEEISIKNDKRETEWFEDFYKKAPNVDRSTEHTVRMKKGRLIVDEDPNNPDETLAEKNKKIHEAFKQLGLDEESTVAYINFLEQLTGNETDDEAIKMAQDLLEDRYESLTEEQKKTIDATTKQALDSRKNIKHLTEDEQAYVSTNENQSLLIVGDKEYAIDPTDAEEYERLNKQRTEAKEQIKKLDKADELNKIDEDYKQKEIEELDKIDKEYKQKKLEEPDRADEIDKEYKQKQIEARDKIYEERKQKRQEVVESVGEEDRHKIEEQEKLIKEADEKQKQIIEKVQKQEPIKPAAPEANEPAVETLSVTRLDIAEKLEQLALAKLEVDELAVAKLTIASSEPLSVQPESHQQVSADNQELADNVEGSDEVKDKQQLHEIQLAATNLYINGNVDLHCPAAIYHGQA